MAASSRYHRWRRRKGGRWILHDFLQMQKEKSSLDKTAKAQHHAIFPRWEEEQTDKKRRKVIREEEEVECAKGGK